jgi:hypothetical protein
MDRLTEERIAKNDARFREANEQIRETALEHGFDPESRVPFICECAEPSCTQILLIPLEAYAEVRSDPRRFLSVLGHEPGPEGASELVSDEGSYVVVEKVGHAGEVAEALAQADGEETGGRA